MFRPRPRLSTWLAIFAMSLNALWPLLSQARPGEPPALHEVCTVDGVKKVAIDGGLPDNRASHGKASPHCAFCSFGSYGSIISQPPHAWIASVVEARDALPKYAFLPPSDADAPSGARPRAPPGHS